MNMLKNILVTGGAGFIGSFLVDQLIQKGYKVKILDNLDTQVHLNSIPPKYLNPEAEFIKGDVRNRKKLKKALQNIEIVFHMASCVGVGQSQYEIQKYTSVNCGGTALLWDIIIQDKLDIKKVIIPGSMTCFGEGISQCNNCGVVKPNIRNDNEINKNDFRCRCPKCNNPVKPIATPSDCKMAPGSVYAISKKFQEDLSLSLSKMYNIPSVVLRYFNVYGPRQSLSNPYTGVSAIFISRIKNGNKPIIYEDGLQTRDFISVHDVVSANLMVMENDILDNRALNLGSGEPIAIIDLGNLLIKLLNSNVKMDITRKFRKGDIRHCYVKKEEIKEKLNFVNKISLEEGMLELAKWSEHQDSEDNFEQATLELKDKGLV